MCESHAYWLSEQNGFDELILEDVVSVRPQQDTILLTNILGDQKEIDAEIDHIDLLKHRIVFRRRSQSERLPSLNI